MHHYNPIWGVSITPKRSSVAGSTCLLSVPMGLPVLHTSYKWNHSYTVSFCVCQFVPSILCSGSVHVVACPRITSFSGCCCVGWTDSIVRSFTCQLMDICCFSCHVEQSVWVVPHLPWAPREVARLCGLGQVGHVSPSSINSITCKQAFFFFL